MIHDRDRFFGAGRFIEEVYASRPAASTVTGATPTAPEVVGWSTWWVQEPPFSVLRCHILRGSPETACIDIHMFCEIVCKLLPTYRPYIMFRPIDIGGR